MDVYSHQYVKFQYQALIPKKFWHRLDLEQFTPLVLNPWHRPVTKYQEEDWPPYIFSPSATCAIRYGDQIRHLLVPKNIAPLTHAAVILLGKTFFSKDRIQRYINLFKSYECMVEDRRIEFSAIRHSLSHPGAKLTRKKTVDTLIAIFNDTVIDLDNYYHLKEFYFYFGLLLMETDAQLHARLIKNLVGAKEIRPGTFILQSNAP